MTGPETRVKVCELCGGEALFHCAADSAFLCRSCDSKVHASNFLVARHVRRILCFSCKYFTGNCISGPVSSGFPGQCLCYKCCSSLSSYSSSSSSSTSTLDSASDCELSSTDAGADRRKTPVRRRRQPTEGKINGEAEDVFVNWCKKLGLGGNSRNSIVSSACWALALTPPVLSFRVRLAAALWFALRVSTNGSEIVTSQNLRKVEVISGVPSKAIAAFEVRLARALRLRRWRIDMEEGWAESDGSCCLSTTEFAL